jgi:hypothetical protein
MTSTDDTKLDFTFYNYYVVINPTTPCLPYIQRHGPFSSHKKAEDFAVALVAHPEIAKLVVKGNNIEIETDVKK